MSYAAGQARTSAAADEVIVRPPARNDRCLIDGWVQRLLTGQHERGVGYPGARR